MSYRKRALFIDKKEIADTILLLGIKCTVITILILAWYLRNQGLLFYAFFWSNFAADIIVYDPRPELHSISYGIMGCIVPLLHFYLAFRIAMFIPLISGFITLVYYVSRRVILLYNVVPGLMNKFRPASDGTLIRVSSKTIAYALRHGFSGLLYCVLNVCIDGNSVLTGFYTIYCLLNIVFVLYFWTKRAILSNGYLTVYGLTEHQYCLQDLRITELNPKWLGRIQFRDSEGKIVFQLNCWFENGNKAWTVLRKMKLL